MIKNQAATSPAHTTLESSEKRSEQASPAATPTPSVSFSHHTARTSLPYYLTRPEQAPDFQLEASATQPTCRPASPFPTRATPSTMCRYYYLHHHHLAPCTRAPDIVVHYAYCAGATAAAPTSSSSSTATGTTGTAATSNATAGSSTDTSPISPPPDPSSPASLSASDRIPALQPCDSLSFDPSQSVDCTDPCATGGCLVSPDCTSGNCRLRDVGGRWTCCRCGEGPEQIPLVSPSHESRPGHAVLSCCVRGLHGRLTGKLVGWPDRRVGST